MINLYTFVGVILLILLPFTMFISDANAVLINAFAIGFNACWLYLAEKQEMLKVIIERGSQQR
mgnify:CR=1 FL=1